MTTTMRKGTEVSWAWGENRAKGRIEEVFTKPVSRTIKGTRIRRNASQKKPAYLVSQSDGGRALKSHTELERVQ
ncbi:DUF2945 domain-containing protein [Bosea sp. (in: a-proteobacteria)]|uniref:DUF2945 domain-containing protein n=1 Tax=Bosea sp. (in: a-proteobacteria) TaxID=1871050 RepID=UPI003B3BC3AC